ncbi:hypothetical protein [Nostoc sp. CALU 546]|uniref:hypothetical protein n=1 Tax=Nostoc sp. CALU 546 TaxID=1867241 RepID=UPI003B67190C
MAAAFTQFLIRILGFFVKTHHYIECEGSCDQGQTTQFSLITAIAYIAASADCCLKTSENPETLIM